MTVGEEHMDAVLAVGRVFSIGAIARRHAANRENRRRRGPGVSAVGGLGHGGLEGLAAPQEIDGVVFLR